MFVASYLLAGLAIVLAWPAPVALSKAGWTARAPFTAMVLWQSIALAGGLSMIGAMLAWGLDPLGANLLDALGGLGRLLAGAPGAAPLGPVHVFALSTALLLGSHLVFTLLLAAYRVSRQRARHRRLLALLSAPSPTQPGTVVLQHEIPVAYCLPGLTAPLTVVSRGLLDSLGPEELRAVVAHERAHLDQRHDLLVLAFESWHQALPWLPTSRLARVAVHELVEMLADDVALREVDAPVLLRALVTVAGAAPAGGLSPSGAADPSGRSPAEPGPAAAGHAPGAPLGSPGARPGWAAAVGASTAEELSSRRIRRLLVPAPVLRPAARASVGAAAALLILAPTVLLVAPGLTG